MNQRIKRFLKLKTDNMKGYKYRDLKYFERNLETLLKNQIYASPFVKLNDPFEGICNEEITQLAKSIESIFKVDSTEVIKNLKEIEDFKTKLGIYSLSKSYSEELLWAHYADSHKGFCIEYEISKLKEKYLAPITVSELSVAYKSRPSTLNPKDIGKNSLLRKLFATKSLKWKYEEELRLIFDSYSLKDYHSSALTGIYFGVELHRDKKQKLIDSLKNRDVKFYEVYRARDSYKLIRKLVHKNQLNISKKLDPNTFEILSTNHTAKIENFNVLFKVKIFDKQSLNYFFNSFRENISTKYCNINLFDEKSILPLIDKYPLSDKEYLEVADHFLALSSFKTPDDFSWYPYQDFQYEERGGKNWIIEN